MAKINIEKMAVNYRNRFLKSVIHDLIVKYGKQDILYIIAECIYEIFGNYPVNIEDDGSRWLSFDDYAAPASVPPVSGWKPSGNVQLGSERGLTPLAPDTATPSDNEAALRK